MLRVLQLEQQFLCGPEIGSGFERGEHVVFGFVALAIGKIGLREIELRGSLVEGIHAITAEYWRIAPLYCSAQPQFAELAMQILAHRVNVVDAVERGGCFGSPEVRLE